MFNSFESVSQVIDDALKSAAQAQKDTSIEANEKFKKAIDILEDYEMKSYFKKTVAKRIAEAEVQDKSSLMILKKLKDKLRVREGFQATFASSYANTNSQPSVEESMMTVEFLIHRTLLDHSPTIVKGETTHQWFSVLISYSSDAPSIFQLVRSSLDLLPFRG